VVSAHGVFVPVRLGAAKGDSCSLPRGQPNVVRFTKGCSWPRLCENPLDLVDCGKRVPEALWLDTLKG
jgi:hypothetical protein